MNSPSNFDFLSSFTHPDFYFFLQRAPNSLSESDSPQFFSKILNVFDQNPPRQVGRAILKSLYEVLSRDVLLEQFTGNGSEKFILMLPTSHKIYLDENLDIFHLIFTRAPNSITAEVAQRFETMIRHRGKKTLILISLYSQHFNSLSDPWPIIDLLFIGVDRFTAVDTAAQFVMILSLLVQSFPEFRVNRCQPAWDVIIQVLKNDEQSNLEIVRFCYESLAGILSVSEIEGEIDIALAKEHLKIPILQSSVLSFLLLIPVSTVLSQIDIERNVSDFITYLVKAATKNVKATLILMNICSASKEVVNILTIDSSWIKRPLPTIIDTLRLFLVVYNSNKDNPTSISVSNKNTAINNKDNNINSVYKDRTMELTSEFASMIIKLNSIAGKSMTNLLAIVLRKVKMNDVVFNKLNKRKFFEDFVQRGGVDESSVYNYLLISDTIGRYAYSDALLKYCSVIYRVIETSETMYPEACQVGINNCRYDRVKEEFKKIGTVELLRTKLEIESSRKHAKRFLKVLDEF